MASQSIFFDTISQAEVVVTGVSAGKNGVDNKQETSTGQDHTLSTYSCLTSTIEPN